MSPHFVASWIVAVCSMCFWPALFAAANNVVNFDNRAPLCCKGASIMLQQLPKSTALRQSLCAHTCKNDVTCAGYAFNNQGCFSCLADFSSWQDAQCTYQNENKGCTETGQCLLCPATQSGFSTVFNTLNAIKFTHLRLYIGSSCHHFDTTSASARPQNTPCDVRMDCAKRHNAQQHVSNF